MIFLLFGHLPQKLLKHMYLIPRVATSPCPSTLLMLLLRRFAARLCSRSSATVFLARALRLDPSFTTYRRTMMTRWLPSQYLKIHLSGMGWFNHWPMCNAASFHLNCSLGSPYHSLDKNHIRLEVGICPPKRPCDVGDLLQQLLGASCEGRDWRLLQRVARHASKYSSSTAPTNDMVS